MTNEMFKKEAFKKSVKDNVKFLYRKTIEEATQEQIFQDRSFLSEFHQVHKRITSITPQHTLKYTKTD